MPHPTCTVCLHEAHELIDSALRSGGSVRAVAKRFGLSPAAVDRHKHHGDHPKTPKNIGQIADIDTEIKKLIRAQNRAKRKRDTAGALAIARELRNWFVLRTKAEVAAIGTAADNAIEQLSPAEALTLAKALVEARLDDLEVRAWLKALVERIPVGPVQTEESDGD